MNESTLDLFEDKANEEAKVIKMAKRYKVSPDYYKLEFDLPSVNPPSIKP
jgi:hypothetical protein